MSEFLRGHAAHTSAAEATLCLSLCPSPDPLKKETLEPMYLAARASALATLALYELTVALEQAWMPRPPDPVTVVEEK